MIDPTMYQGDPEMLREAMGIATRRMNPDVEAARGQVEALQGEDLYNPTTQALRDARESWAEDRAMMSDGLAAGQQALNVGIGQAGAPNLYAGRGDAIRGEVQQQNQGDIGNLLNARNQAQGALQAAQSSDLAERGDVRAESEFGMRVDDRDLKDVERMRTEDPNDPRARALQAQFAQVFPHIPPQEFEGKGLADLELEKPFFERRQQLEMEHRAARARAAAHRRQMAAAQMDLEQKLAIASNEIAKRDPEMLSRDPALFRATAQQLANNDKAIDAILQGSGGAGGQIKTAGGSFAFNGDKEDPTTRKDVGTRIAATNTALEAGKELLEATRDYSVRDMATDTIGRSKAADKFVQARERFVTNALKARGQNPDKDSNAYKSLMDQIGDIRTKGVALGIVDPSGPLTNILRTLPGDTADYARAQGYEPPPSYGAMPEQMQAQAAGGKAPPKRRPSARRRTSTIVEFADGSRREVPNTQVEAAASKPGARVWEGY